MPHQFIHADDKRLEGVWRTYNGRRFCAWRFEPTTGTLKTSRGVVVRSVTVKSKMNTLEELKDVLPKLALEMAKGNAKAA